MCHVGDKMDMAEDYMDLNFYRNWVHNISGNNGFLEIGLSM